MPEAAKTGQDFARLEEGNSKECIPSSVDSQAAESEGPNRENHWMAFWFITAVVSIALWGAVAWCLS